jgi:hypothetical protein
MCRAHGTNKPGMRSSSRVNCPPALAICEMSLRFRRVPSALNDLAVIAIPGTCGTHKIENTPEERQMTTFVVNVKDLDRWNFTRR